MTVVPQLCKQICNFYVKTINPALLLTGIFILIGLVLMTYFDGKYGILIAKFNLYVFMLPRA
jgi:hypothetical protein